MNAMFENILVEYAHYGVEVLSSPALGAGKPWVVTLDNFLTDSQVDALISTNTKFERSTDTGSSNEFGEVYIFHINCKIRREYICISQTGRILSNTRTSSNSWCRGDCLSHPSVMEVVQRIEAVTRVPSVSKLYIDVFWIVHS